MAKRFYAPVGMDKECIVLCRAMNNLQGITTTESCCGHGKEPFQIWFKVDKLSDLPKLLFHFDACHCGFDGWFVDVMTDCGMAPVHFRVNGPKGAYAEADKIAHLIKTCKYKGVTGWSKRAQKECFG